MKVSGQKLPITTCEEDWARIMGDYPMETPSKRRPKKARKLHRPLNNKPYLHISSFGSGYADWFHAGLVDEIDLDELNNVYTLEHNHGWNRFNGMAA